MKQTWFKAKHDLSPKILHVPRASEDDATDENKMRWYLQPTYDLAISRDDGFLLRGTSDSGGQVQKCDVTSTQDYPNYSTISSPRAEQRNQKYTVL